MGNLSSKRNVIQRKVRQNAVNNNAYNVRNRPVNSQFTTIDSSLWPKPKRPPEHRLYEPTISNPINEVSDFLGKSATLVDLSDTSTLTVSSDEISSRSSSDTLNPSLPSKRNQPCLDEKQVNRSVSGDNSEKTNSEYLNLESLPTPTGCNRFRPQHLSNVLEDNLVSDASIHHKPPLRKEMKPPAQLKTAPPPKAFRQSINNPPNARPMNQQSVMPGLRPKQINNAASNRHPQKPLQPLRPSTNSQSVVSEAKTALTKPSQPAARHIKQFENHNSHRGHDSRADCSSWKNQSRASNYKNDSSHLRSVSRSSLSVNILSNSPYPRHPCLRGFKKSSNLKPILLSPKDSCQSYIRSCASNPKSSKRNLRSPLKSPKVEHVPKSGKIHGLRKISDSEYQKYNAIINDFHCSMKARKGFERHGLSESRSPSVESKVSSIDNLKSKAYDETDDEIYSFPVSSTFVRSPSQTERSHSVGSFGDTRPDPSSFSNHLKTLNSIGRTIKQSITDSRSSSLQRSSTNSYVVEIDGNINELKCQTKDPKAIFCYKFFVNDGRVLQKMLTDSKDRRIETICRQTACRIHVKRRWLRHCSQPPSYDIICFARDIKSIEKCCNLFHVMFPTFNAEAGLGY